jgi:LPS-assembly protein
MPEPAPASGKPIRIQAQNQTWSNADKTWTLSGNVVIHYEGYVLRADRAVYNEATTELEAEGHVRVSGGPQNVLIYASHGVMRLNAHTGRFYDVHGSQGVRRIGLRPANSTTNPLLSSGRVPVYSTPNPLLFSGKELVQLGDNDYRLIDGSITNCRLPHPDWRIISRSIALANGQASTTNSFFEFLGAPIFYLPYLHHAVAAGGRQSGLLIPVVGNDSIRGYIVGEQVYWAISRSMDMVLGSEYFSKRGWAPNGDFRYRGRGLDNVRVNWSALLDRGIEESTPSGPELINQGGVDIDGYGSKSLGPGTRIAGTAEYLSSYVYRLVFDENYSAATSSQVSSNVAYIHNSGGLIPSVGLERFQNFASTTNGDEVRLLHLPNVRYDVLDRPLGVSHLYWGLGSSLDYLSRSEPHFHSRNVGRMDFYPHLSLPLHGGGWSLLAQGAFRETAYTKSQIPDLTGANNGIPTISHEPLNRVDAEASVDIRPPVLERDFTLPWNRQLRHVIEPELNYRYVGGIGSQARNVLLFDTTDVATNVNEAGFSLTQRFYLHPTVQPPCAAAAAGAAKGCSTQPREWASWRIAQEYFINPNFGGALIPGRRNVFDSTLGLMAATFLTSPRNIAPITSRIRFQAVKNLRIQWDMDYDTIRGQLLADNLYAGYSWGRTTISLTHALLNAVDENAGGSGASSTLRSQELQPYLQIGKQSGKGFDMAFNGGYDFVQHTLQYAGVQAVYNWDCCGLTVGYRRFELGTANTTSRDETQWLYSFTLADFSNVGDIRRATSIFRDPRLPPAY